MAYAEVDLSNGKIQSSGGLWKDYVAEGEREALNYMKVFNRHIDELVLEEDQVGCYDVLEQEKMVYNYNSGTATVNYQLRRRMARRKLPLDGAYRTCISGAGNRKYVCTAVS
ncbi:MAG: hypothetical protein ACLUN0_01765 [Roseburia sp.]